MSNLELVDRDLKCPHCEAVVAEPEQLGENRKSWGSGREICKTCTKEFEWKRKAMIVYESTKVETEETPTALSAEISGQNESQTEKGEVK